MNQQLLEHLISPVTHEPLRVCVDRIENDCVAEGSLVGTQDESFPIHGGIPTLIDPNLTETQTIRSFAQKWAKQNGYRSHTDKFYTNWYLERYGFYDISKLEETLADKEFILDAGTGAGRDASNFVTHASGTVYAVDAARAALDSAKANANNPRLGFVQADINNLPFPDEFFDFISCDQVIHHTNDPRRAFDQLNSKLKRGGEICCYVYRKKAAIREYTDDMVRDKIADLPADQAMELCEGITRLAQQLAALGATIEIEKDIPLLGIEKGKFDLQRFFHWNIMKCFWNDDFDFFTNNLINFDWYHPRNCFRFEPKEFRSWFDKGWEVLSWDVREAGISCRARKI